jgi:cytochrome bd-type quinol oxidase subunit 2
MVGEGRSRVQHDAKQSRTSLLQVSLWNAAAAVQSQASLLIGTLFLLPIILMYTSWSYRVFRGKVRGDIVYHYQRLT